jgi:hypothetical protein
MMVVHDDNLLVAINGIGHDTVSGVLNCGYTVLLTPYMLAVTRDPRARRDDGSPPEVQTRDTSSFVW